MWRGVLAHERKGKWVETSAWGRGFCKRTKDKGIKLPPPNCLGVPGQQKDRG